EWHINTLYGVASRALNRMIYEYGLLGVVLYSLVLLLCARAVKASCRLAGTPDIFSVAIVILALLVAFTITNYYSVLTDRMIGIYVWTIIGVSLAGFIHAEPKQSPNPLSSRY
ncbi:MAG: hypothetical protein JSW54_09485, partial [Fidelibacterota bacterium]